MASVLAAGVHCEGYFFTHDGLQPSLHIKDSKFNLFSKSCFPSYLSYF
jgi:hypothetical protein